MPLGCRSVSSLGSDTGVPHSTGDTWDTAPRGSHREPSHQGGHTGVPHLGRGGHTKQGVTQGTPPALWAARPEERAGPASLDTPTSHTSPTRAPPPPRCRGRSRAARRPLRSVPAPTGAAVRLPPRFIGEPQRDPSGPLLSLPSDELGVETPPSQQLLVSPRLRRQRGQAGGLSSGSPLAAGGRAAPRLTSATRPWASTAMRCAPRMVLRRCAMSSTVRPAAARSSASCTARSACASSALVASSRISTAGSLSRARAMAMRCFCPPDSAVPRSPAGHRGDGAAAPS